jgi:hypothetical protein
VNVARHCEATKAKEVTHVVIRRDRLAFRYTYVTQSGNGTRAEESLASRLYGRPLISRKPSVAIQYASNTRELVDAG